MDRRHVDNGIERSWAFIESLGLSESFSNAGSLDVSEEWRDLALMESTTYAELYQFGLQLSHYNFCLTDYSFFQFGWDARDCVRYAYFPNPFITGEEGLQRFRRLQSLVARAEITLEEYNSILRDAPPENRVPMFRYENAPSQWKELRHPCSHLHIGHHSENRWAVNRLITPLAFTMLVMKHYYPTEWDILGEDERSAGGNRFEAELIAERSNCFTLGDMHFSEIERRSFSFG